MAVLESSSNLLAEKYERSVEAMKSLQMPPIGQYVSEAGSKANERISTMAKSTLGLFALFRWPSFNFTWIGGEKRSSVVNNFFAASTGGAEVKEKIIQEKVVERVVVHDWSQADLSGLRDELKKELKLYVEGLIDEKERKWNGQPRGLTSEEVDNVMNTLLDKLRAGDYFKLDLTQENFRAIFLEMRQRFLDDNEVFVSQLVAQVQSSMDLSSWDEKLEALRAMILGTNGDLKRVEGDLLRIREEMATKDDLKGLKAALMALINEMVKAKVTEMVEVQILKVKEEQLLAVKESATGGDPPTGAATLANEDEVRRLITGALKVYDADKTGLADYALESSGGQVVSTRCTENYHTKSAQISVFGIPLWYPSNTPRTAIQPNVLPGNCWAFQGFPGFLVLQLNMDIYVSGFTMEHIPKSLSNGRIDSAPKRFTVWGLDNENDQDPAKFGTYEYSDADEASSYQYFDVQNEEIQRKFRIVELRIESNHGHMNYTCLYRFRVHGSPI